MLFSLIHELGHLICGILLGFTAKSFNLSMILSILQIIK